MNHRTSTKTLYAISFNKSRNGGVIKMKKIAEDCKKLIGKTAIITGSSRGMGRAAALLFAQHGADVVVNYHSNKEAADKVVDGIKELGCKAIAVKGDIGNMNDLPCLIDACLEEFGKIDILYHNAAVHYVCHDLEDVTEEVWDMTYNQIIKGPFFLTKLAIPHLKKQPGSSILFTSTSSAGTATPTDPHYMTAKNAVNVLYKIFAGWLAPEIRVNCVVPGFVKTDMFRHHPPQSWEALSAMVPMQRMADPFDVAKAALYLASDDAAFLTGVDIPVDGGRMAAIPRRSVLPLLEAMKAGTDQFEKDEYEKENIEKIDAGL
jgi:3-oxoacyl-[acyl-carrier protein] reductase